MGSFESKEEMIAEAERSKDSFCVLPWHHMYIDPSGNCKPCCLIQDLSSWGNIHQNSLSEIWNNEKFTSFRKTILKFGAPKDLCRVCVKGETSKTDSPRMRFNREITHDHSRILEHTSNEGFYPGPDLKVLDFRPSNLCNLKCRTCGPEFSSSWAKEENTDLKKIRREEFSFSDEQILGLEEIYFAGGEPLLMKEHYDLLVRLIRWKKTKVRLRYNSNATVLSFAGQSVMELWKHFDHVYFSCSVDDFGERAEYLRSGSNWEKIVENILTIRQQSPNVRVSPNITVSIFNVFYLPEILEEFLRLGVLEKKNPFDFTFNIVNEPNFFSPFLLPLESQGIVKEKLSILFQRWKSEFPPSGFYLYQSLIDQLGVRELPLVEQFLKNVKRVDEKRGESFSQVYPELAQMLQS